MAAQRQREPKGRLGSRRAFLDAHHSRPRSTWQTKADLGLLSMLLALASLPVSACEDMSGGPPPPAGSNGAHISDPGSETTGVHGTGPLSEPTAEDEDCSRVPEAGLTRPAVIWIANSPEGTVSKIDTRTGVELARYFTGPREGGDDPSRTSVNLAGDVAVTNRAGSVTKIASTLQNCVDRSGNGTIETSRGPKDTLPWGTDECVLWHRPLVDVASHTHGPRPTAWNGNPGPAGFDCGASTESLWVGWWDADRNAGEFRRIHGDTGAVRDAISVPDWTRQLTGHGPYGGAVDGTGSLWVIGLFENLVRIDSTTLEVSRWDLPLDANPYGIAVDAWGRPWLAGFGGTVTRFDPETEHFDTLSIAHRRLRGLQLDRAGRVWIAANAPCGVIAVDAHSMQLIDDGIELPGCREPVGVSIDHDGFVWLPDRLADLAFKLNPETLETTITAGLVGPYTYSDMTGAALGLVAYPPAP